MGAHDAALFFSAFQQNQRKENTRKTSGDQPGPTTRHSFSAFRKNSTKPKEGKQQENKRGPTGEHQENKRGPTGANDAALFFRVSKKLNKTKGRKTAGKQAGANGGQRRGTIFPRFEKTQQNQRNENSRKTSGGQRGPTTRHSFSAVRKNSTKPKE